MAAEDVQRIAVPRGGEDLVLQDLQQNRRRLQQCRVIIHNKDLLRAACGGKCRTAHPGGLRHLEFLRLGRQHRFRGREKYPKSRAHSKG